MTPCQEARKKREEKEARKLHHHWHLASTGFCDMFPSDVQHNGKSWWDQLRYRADVRKRREEARKGKGETRQRS